MALTRSLAPEAPRTGTKPPHANRSSTNAGAGKRTPAVVPLQALVFEVANVLYDATAWRRELVKLLAHLGVTASYPSFYVAWDEAYLPAVHCGYRQYDEAFQSFLLASGLSWAQIDEVEAACRSRREELEQGLRPLPGVVYTMDRLVERRLPLAILADTPHSAERLRQRLDSLGLGGRFKHVLSSFDLESVKPAAACYEAAIGALELPPQAVAFVGCSVACLAGARQAGLRTIAFNSAEKIRADATVEHFPNLLDVVEAWSAVASQRGAA